MDYYAGIDVSLEYSSVCVVDASGKVVREARVVSEPEALVGWFGSLGLELARIGLEAEALAERLPCGMERGRPAGELLWDPPGIDGVEPLPVEEGPQAGAEQAAGPREQPARDLARLRAEGRQDDADKLCRAHRRAGEGASEPSDDRAGAASGAGRSACRVQRF